jgi:hypothetical protein
MKKYWKRIRKGWRRTHYVLSVIFSIILIFSYLENGFGGGYFSEWVIGVMFILFLLLYFLIVIIIEWIKEGFEDNK